MTLLFPTLRGRRGIAVAFLAALSATAAFVPSADARHFPRHMATGGHVPSGGGHTETSGPPYAAIVVDANSGAVLHAANPDELRHPASLTKIMTLYLLFERLEAGKLKLDSQLEVSEHAASQSPTKLGLRPGQTIAVEDAIGGLVTRSANDAAVVIAEAIGGSEADFAEMMTRKAHALGMSRTLYRNASGLPNDEQITTARDQALLGRAIQERFPHYYRFFSMTSFAYHGSEIRNHNHLLGHVEGVDGIKTGYTQASGFNLVTSVRRDNRHIVAVVLGGASAASRDARMRTLIEEYIVAASAKRTAVGIAEVPSGAGVREAPADTRTLDTRPAERAEPPVLERIARALSGRSAEPQTAPVNEAREARDERPQTQIPGQSVYTVASSSSRPLPWSALQRTAPPADVPPAAPTMEREVAANHASDPIRPIQVKTVKAKLSGNQVAAIAPSSTVDAEDRSPAAEATSPEPSRATTGAMSGSAPATGRGAPFWEPVREVPYETPIRAPHEVVRDIPHEAPIVPPAATSARRPMNVASIAPVPRQATEPKPLPAPAPRAQAEHPVLSAAHTGWIIQIGAFEAEREAREKINAVRARASRMLARADSFTETVVKDNKTFYRARFAGLQKDEAEEVCRQLKRNDIACMTVKN